MRHRRAMGFLPWYANGTLEEAERQAVEAHLSACPACARKLESLAALRQALGESEELRPSPDLLQRTLARVDAFERRPARVAEPGWLERLRRRVAGALDALWTSPPTPARLVMAVQQVLVLALAAALIRTGAPGPRSHRRRAGSGSGLCAEAESRR